MNNIGEKPTRIMYSSTRISVKWKLLLLSFAHIIVQSLAKKDIVTDSAVFLTGSAHSSYAISDDKWQNFVSNSRVVKVEPGCGRMQNRLITFEDGAKACARYRLNTNLMQGEIYSYYVAKLLQIDNLPPLAVSKPDINSDQWQKVADQVLEANWQSNKLLILTKYITDTHEVTLPQILKTLDSGEIIVTPEQTTPENSDIFSQWSDMIVFDYIVGNMDRLVNSLHNKQWNANIMESSVHNLAQKNNKLIFFDNEDGLFHGYRILDRYSHYHEQSLKSVCVFSKSTAESILNLVQSGDVTHTLTELISHDQPDVLQYLPKISSKTSKILSQRLANVADHIRGCAAKYH